MIIKTTRRSAVVASLLTSVSTIWTVPVFAQTQLSAESPTSDSVTTVAPVVVTATRVAQTADETLAAVTVITREDLEKRQTQTVQDALRGVPGLSFTNNGGLGKATSVFLRGTESDHVLVLIDGVKVGSASLGTTAFQDIPIEQIERIEVVRGPRSSLYGSEAIGGVIQIFTRKGGGPWQPQFKVSAGSYDTYSLTAGIAGGGERSWFNATLSGIDTKGFNACEGEPLVGGCFTNEPDDDGYSNLSGSLRAGYRFANDAEVELRWLRAEGENDFDGSFVNESETVQQVLSGSLRYAPTDTWDLSLLVGQSRDESDNFKDGDFQSRFDTERFTASLQNDVYLSDEQLLTVGVDYQDDQVDGTTDYVVDSRDNTGVFAQYQAAFGAQNMQLSLRHDDNEQFGDETTGSVAWGYEFSEQFRVSASYGTAFKAPTFNELYFPNFGNPGLDPEESQSIELGMSGRYDWANWAVSIYQTEVDELIAFDAATEAPANVDEARIQGLEATLSGRVADWDLQTALTLLDPENRSAGSNRGNDLPRRAQQAFRLDLDRDFGRYSLGATLFAEGSRYDDLANTRELGGYGTVDLRGGYELAKHWLLEARVANVFDKDYKTAAFYNQPGSSFFLTLRYQP